MVDELLMFIYFWYYYIIHRRGNDVGCTASVNMNIILIDLTDIEYVNVNVGGQITFSHQTNRELGLLIYFLYKDVSCIYCWN